MPSPARRRPAATGSDATFDQGRLVGAGRTDAVAVGAGVAFSGVRVLVAEAVGDGVAVRFGAGDALGVRVAFGVRVGAPVGVADGVREGFGVSLRFSRRASRSARRCSWASRLLGPVEGAGRMTT